MNESESTFLGSVAADWRTKHLKRIGRLKGGAGFPHDEQGVTNEAIPFFKVKNLRSPRFLTDAEHTVSQHTAKQLNAEILPANTIVFAKVGAALLLNRFRILAQPSCIDNNMFGLVFDHQCERDFLFYLFNRIEFSELFNQGPVPSVNGKQVGYITIPLPLLPEQKRIAAYLNASCEAIDRAMEAKQKQLKTLSALRKSIIQRAVTQGLNPDSKVRDSGVEWLGPIPIHWKVQKLKRVLSKIDYGISQSTEQDGAYAVLKMGNIVRGEIAFTKIEFVSDVMPDLILEKNDLLFNRTNSLDQVAKVGIFRGDSSENITYASYLVRLRANHKNHPDFLNYLLNAEIFLGLARKMAIPSVQQANLNPTRYCRLEIPVPPLPEQIEIASYLDTKSEQIRQIEQRLNDQLACLDTYRKSLIHECVTGKRRISDADVAKAEYHV